MKEEPRVDRYTKVVLTLIVILLAALLCKPLFVTKPVTAYTTADDAYYHADQAYYLADKALEEAEKAYSHADSAYYRAEEAYQKAEESYSEASREAYTAKSRADEAYKKANKAYKTANEAYDKADNASWRAERDLLKVAEVLAMFGFFIRNNREDLVKIGEKLEITVSSLQELRREFEEKKEREK